jgi:asparagine synthase (glutamine-hydrolysing)
MAKLVREPISTFAVGFAEREANELPYARMVAERLGARHHEVVVSPEEYFAALPRLVWQEDEPIAFTSSVPLYFVSRLARDHVKVVLTGEGSDELFLGYNRYRVSYWNHLLGRTYWAVAPKKLRMKIRSAITSLPASVRRYPSRTFLALEPGPRSIFFENFSLFPDRLRSRVLSSRLDDDGRDPYAVGLQWYDDGEGGPLDRMGRSDMHTYLHELLMKQDQMSMAASIESRVPFLDDEIIEHVSALPAAFKLRGWTTKAVLRAAVRDVVPPEILTRKKMGFPVPIGSWLRQRFWPVVDEFVLGERARRRGLFDAAAVWHLAAEHRAGVAEHGDRLWLLINLEMWQRIFCDGENPSDVMQPLRHVPITRPTAEPGAQPVYA